MFLGWLPLPQYGPGILQDDAADFGFLGHFQVGPAALGKALPGITGRCGNGLQALIHFTVDLLHHRRQQPLLVTEVVIQRAPGQPGFGGQVVHRGLGVAQAGKGLARAGNQPGAGLLDHRGAWAAAHGHSSPTNGGLTYEAYVYMIFNIRGVCVSTVPALCGKLQPPKESL